MRIFNAFFNYTVLPFVVIFIFGCAPKYYMVPEYLKTPHASEMAKFNDKKAVLMHFGVPDKSVTLDSIEILEYQMGQITNSVGKSKSLSLGRSANTNNSLDIIYSGTLMQNNNPYYNPSNMNSLSNVVLSQYVTSTTTSSSSETTLKFAKFWLINGVVMKWETQGIDLGKNYPNPNYSLEEKAKVESNNTRTPPVWQFLIFFGIGGLLFAIM